MASRFGINTDPIIDESWPILDLDQTVDTMFEAVSRNEFRNVMWKSVRHATTELATSRKQQINPDLLGPAARILTGRNFVLSYETSGGQRRFSWNPRAWRAVTE